MSALNGTVLQAAEGDREAFSRLYDTFSRPVFLTLVGILRTREDAEDALQAAFLAVWERGPSVSCPGSSASLETRHGTPPGGGGTGFFRTRRLKT